MKKATVIAFITPITAGYLLLTAVIAHAQSPYELVQQGKIKPLTEILQTLTDSYRGEVIDVELERDDGLYIYEIEMIGPQGQKAEFEFDAATGQLISLEGKRLQEMRKPTGAIE